MQHRDAVQRMRHLWRRQPDSTDSPNALSGPTLIEQEPDLAKEEASRYNVAVSSWSAGGQPTD